MEAVHDADAEHGDIALTEMRWPFPCHSSLAPAMQNTTTALVGEVGTATVSDMRQEALYAMVRWATAGASDMR